MTCDMRGMERGEHSLKISGPYLILFGSEGVLKIFEQMDDSPPQRMTKVFVEQPQLNTVCKLEIVAPLIASLIPLQNLQLDIVINSEPMNQFQYCRL